MLRTPKSGATRPSPKSKSAAPAKRRASRRPRGAAEAPPRFRAYIAISLDGYIADSDGGVDWLNPFFSPEIDFGGFMKTIGAVVMGRKTYDIAATRGDLGGDAMTAVVLTHNPLQGAPRGVKAFNPDRGAESRSADVRAGQIGTEPGDVLLAQRNDNLRNLAAGLRRALAAGPRQSDNRPKDIWLMGGGQAIDAFRQAGLVDRWELAIMPVLLGHGIPLFPGRSPGMNGLRLINSRTLSNGVVEVAYEADTR